MGVLLNRSIKTSSFFLCNLLYCQKPSVTYNRHFIHSIGSVQSSCVSPDFRAVGDYQLDYSLDFSLLSNQATVSITPSLASRAHGFVRTSGLQYATVSLDGSVLEASLPLNLWQDFQTWPLTARSVMQ